MRSSGLRLEFEPGDRRAPPDPRPLTRQRVSAGWPFGSTFIHQPRLSSSRPSGKSIAPLSPSGRAGDDRPIGLGDLALLEQEPQFLQRLVMASEHEAARRVAIEPVRERRVSRQSEPEGVEIVLEARAAFRAAVDRDARPACRGPASVRRGRAAALLFLPASWDSGMPTGRPRIGAASRGFLALDDDDEKKAKSGLLRRWFGGAATPRRSRRQPRVASELETPPPIPPRPRPPRSRDGAGFSAFASGLSRSSTNIARGVADIFTKRKLDAASLDDLEDVLIQADLGLGAATRIREAVARGRYEQRDQSRRGQARSSPPKSSARWRRSPARSMIDAEQAAVRHPRRRRQRLGQDDDDRQARGQVRGRREDGRARRGRHLPRRGDRAIAHLGATHVFRPRRARAGRRRGRASPSTR